MKKLYIKNIFKSSLVLLFFTFITGCDLLDPTDVNNPQTTTEQIKENPRGTARGFVNGIVERMSDAMEDLIFFTDVVSDNYVNTQTNISPQLDYPSAIYPTDLTLDQRGNAAGNSSPYWEIQELRSLANYTLNTVIPIDPLATSQHKGETLFYRAMAGILMAENFSAAPVEENGMALPANQLLALAIDDLIGAQNTYSSASFDQKTNLALARAYRLQSDKIKAKEHAELAAVGDYVFYSEYDATNSTSLHYYYLVGRNQADMQPLPRLDFLDPKYIAEDTPAPVLKVEEAHLILAEIALSDGDFNTAAQKLADAIKLANSREREDFIDLDQRIGRPDSGSVKSSPNAAIKDGLLLKRSGSEIQVPVISATSLDADSVLNLDNGEDLLHALYLARQEIFFLEARRMSDLGIRLPMQATEIETNPNITTGDLGTSIYIPDYIPASNEMDLFDVNNGLVTIDIDMNQRLAENRISPFLLPF